MTTSPSNSRPVASMQEFERLVALARQEPVPVVDVTHPVLARIARVPLSTWLPQERVIVVGAGMSALLAASLLFVVWSTSQNLVDPSSGWFQPFEVTLLERP